jgi:hypothetical protein
MKLLLFLLALLAPVASCKTLGGSGGIAERIVNCGSDAIMERSILYIGRVNDVLSDQGISDDGARSGLVQLGIDVGQDVLGCILRDQHGKFQENVKANSSDVASRTAIKRSGAHLGELENAGWRFQ